MAANLTQTLSFGVYEGGRFNDAEDIGGFPKIQNIAGIKQIRLSAAWLVDGIEITYRLKDGFTTVANHLGKAQPNVTIAFSDTEVLIGVTGKTGVPGYYNNKPYLNYLSFVILDTKTGKARVQGPYGNGGGDTIYTGQPFSVAGPIIAFAGKQATGSGDPNNAITLSFIKAEAPAVSGDLN